MMLSEALFNILMEDLTNIIKQGKKEVEGREKADGIDKLLQ